ncbi:MAG: polyphosphate polymerase domain-containing protein [Tessaracoccus sp.]|uniref:polyphosphate polymerase domain-containing protein n=1 Tax=Tessaracoccus sp. TaxID=1971211 RepID=UPI001EBA655C|nr:polyphosphate polymerase domain-containing protein [Tessaracoccus sp.]MBK7820453.1 polyphosphate polymerase domain-containing protein [Tessaracoccus sp.]
MGALAPLGRFRPIGLDDLVAQAEMLTRIDRKYLLTPAQAEEFLLRLDPSTEALQIDGALAARYETVYFDTADWISFRMSAHQRRVRMKVRTRTYVDSGATFLEVKSCGASGVTVKERIPYDGGRDRLTLDARAYLADAATRLGLGGGLAYELFLVIRTTYDRSTLLAPGGAGRVTVDTDLAWSLPDGATLDLPGLAIVETKSLSATSVTDRLLWRAGHRPVSVSKFATGLAALRPDLPRNRWARILRGAFAARSPELMRAS